MVSLPGTYALILRSSTTQSIQVGRLGELTVRPGYYFYVGSALGPGGLAARIGRHLRCDKRLHWHIDYLRQAAEIEELWYTTDPARRECEWAQFLGQTPGALIPLKGFGASDCGCESHLLWAESTMQLTSLGVFPMQRVIYKTKVKQ